MTKRLALRLPYISWIQPMQLIESFSAVFGEDGTENMFEAACLVSIQYSHRYSWMLTASTILIYTTPAISSLAANQCLQQHNTAPCGDVKYNLVTSVEATWPKTCCRTHFDHWNCDKKSLLPAIVCLEGNLPCWPRRFPYIWAKFSIACSGRKAWMKMTETKCFYAHNNHLEVQDPCFSNFFNSGQPYYV